MRYELGPDNENTVPLGWHVIVEPRRRDSGEIYRVIEVDGFSHPHVEWIACGLWLTAKGMPIDMVEYWPLATPEEIEAELARPGYRRQDI